MIALLGSGETAPGMTKVHRRLLARHDAVRAVNLDTPYGFQANVEQVTGKLVDYFATSLSTTLRNLALPSYDAAGDLQRALVKHEVAGASYVFAGPGSPSYALAQWRPLELVEDLRRALARDATVCFSSAAVLTLGSHTAPIYEIYKVGSRPEWLEGLDLLGDLGLACAAIPHFDNAEGRNYDTRYCYLGESRLEALERQLPDGVAVLGVDEHTALLFDLADDTVSVVGRSAGHWRYRGRTLLLANATTTPLDALREFVGAAAALPSRESSPAPEASDALGDLIARLSGNVHGFDLAPLIDGILQLRQRAKDERNFALADELRGVLTNAGVEVRDEPTSSTWILRSE